MSDAPDDAANEARRRRGWVDSDDCAAIDDATLERRLRDARAVLIRRDPAPDGAAARRVAACALKTRTPIVAVRGPGIDGFVRHAVDGYVSASDDENHLRAAVAKLLRDDVLWARLRGAPPAAPGGEG